MSRNRVRSTLLIVGIIALALALLPNVQYESGGVSTEARRDHLRRFPERIPSRTDVSLGWRASPLFTYDGKTVLTEEAGVFARAH